MKKIILLLSVAISSFASYAQVSFGAQVGANLGMGHTSYDNSLVAAAAIGSLSSSPKVGFLIGVIGEVDFGKLAFRPELNFIQKGSKDDGGYDVYGYSLASYDVTKRTLNYVELPLNVVYNLKLSQAGKAFFGLGPAIAFGLSGTDKGPVYNANTDESPIVKTTIKFDGEKSSSDGYKHFKRTDIGLNVLAGFQLKMGAFVKLGYTYGFANIDPVSTYKNRGFSVCIGYMLGGK